MKERRQAVRLLAILHSILSSRSGCPMGILFFGKMGLERPLRKHAGGMFLGRGRVLQTQDASGTDVDWVCISSHLL